MYGEKNFYKQTTTKESSKKLDDIHAIGEAEITLIQRQSALLLQKKNNGFNGELKTSGAIIENYIKGLLQNHLPHGYRICSGYIATADTILDVENMLQHDIIIVDDRMPSLYKFGIGDIEVVPAEAVCGIVEVKRTLNKKSLLSAIEHLKHTKKILDAYDDGVKSKDRAMNGVVGSTLSIACVSPIYSVIALDALEEIAEPVYFSEVIAPAMQEFLDMIWAPAAPYISVIQWQAREDGTPYAATNVARNDPTYEVTRAPGGFNDFRMENSARIYRNAIFRLRTWINNCSGAPMTASKNARYFDAL